MDQAEPVTYTLHTINCKVYREVPKPDQIGSTIRTAVPVVAQNLLVVQVPCSKTSFVFAPPQSFGPNTMFTVRLPEVEFKTSLPPKKRRKLFSSRSYSKINVDKEFKDVFNWKDGVGSIDGVSIKFRLNDNGDLEEIQSDK